MTTRPASKAVCFFVRKRNFLLEVHSFLIQCVLYVAQTADTEFATIYQFDNIVKAFSSKYRDGELQFQGLNSISKYAFIKAIFLASDISCILQAACASYVAYGKKKGRIMRTNTSMWLGLRKTCSCLSVSLLPIKEHFTWSTAQIYVDPQG